MCARLYGATVVRSRDTGCTRSSASMRWRASSTLPASEEIARSAASRASSSVSVPNVYAAGDGEEERGRFGPVAQ
jgi:hypothetical protein